MRYLSFGANCQPAYQLRRITGQTEAYFFDWLVTHHDALIKVLTHGPDRLLERSELVNNGKTVLDDSTGLRFYAHDFSNTNGIISPGFTTELASVRDKYMRRWQRTLELIRSCPNLCIVRLYLHCSDEEIRQQTTEIEGVVQQLSPTGAVSFLWVTTNASPLPNSASVATTPERWQGDDMSWDRIITPGSRPIFRSFQA